MRVAGALVVVFTTGCFAPSAPSGVVCDPLAPVCPDGQQCVLRGGAHECSTGEGDPIVPPDASSDLDGDGIIDMLDLCPAVADPAQDNEDGDRFGDACDPCPPIADDDPPDRDADGVGDACDPDSSRATDRIVRFDGFHHALDAWHATGEWSVTGDGAVITAGTDTASLTMPTPPGQVTIRAAFRVDELTGTLTYSAAGTIDQASEHAGIACYAFRTPSGLNRLGLIRVSDALTLDADTMKVSPGERYVVTLTHDSGPYLCSGVHDANETTSTATYSPAPAQPELGLVAHAASVTFDWILVVAAP